jgi:AraC-like DNA-binding protein
MIPANVPHTWFSSSEQKEETYCSVIQFLPDAWGNDFWQLQDLREFHQLRNKAQRGVRFDGPGLAEVGLLMEELANHDVPSIRSLCSLLEIFSRLSELEMHSLHSVEEDRSRFGNPRLDDLLAWIEEHLEGDLTQKDAAARVNMTPTAFSRWFKISMGCQFQRYLNEIRVARVCSEIAHGKLSITEAAFRVGYNNLSNFNRRFMEITGLTPKAYRKQIQGGPVVGRVLGRNGGTAPERPVRVNWSAPLNPGLPEDQIDPKWRGDSA